MATFSSSSSSTKNYKFFVICTNSLNMRYKWKVEMTASFNEFRFFCFCAETELMNKYIFFKEKKKLWEKNFQSILNTYKLSCVRKFLQVPFVFPFFLQTFFFFCFFFLSHELNRRIGVMGKRVMLIVCFQH